MLYVQCVQTVSAQQRPVLIRQQIVTEPTSSSSSGEAAGPEEMPLTQVQTLAARAVLRSTQPDFGSGDHGLLSVYYRDDEGLALAEDRIHVFII